MSITTRPQVTDAYFSFERLDALKKVEAAGGVPTNTLWLLAGTQRVELLPHELAAVLALLRAPLVDRIQRLGVEA